MRPGFSALPAVLAATLVCVTVPAVAQAHGNSSFADERTPYHGQVVEEIIARVNDQVISLSDYNRAEQQLDQQAQQEGWTRQQLYEQKHDLLRSLIDKQLLLSKGKQLGITGDNGVIRRLDEMRKQYHMATMEDLEKAAEAQGVSWEDLKEQIRENVITSRVIGQEVGERIEVAPSEIQSYYDAHKKEFTEPEEVQLSEILIPTANPDNAAQVATAKNQAESIEQRLKAGADFATLAKADSSGPTASDGGNLGEYKRGVLPKVMEDATFSLKAGQWTQPIRTKQGWLILEVTKHQAAGVEPLSKVSDQIRQIVGMKKLQPMLRAYLTKLRSQAYINIRPGYVDAGASPHEMKFIQSAYVPPGPKKKKQRGRFRMKPVKKHKKRVQPEVASAQEAQTGMQKPGKKEKIRYGQAPRESLPAAQTRYVNAGAEPSGDVLTNANGQVINNSGNQGKHKKLRFQNQKQLPKDLRWSRNKQKYVAPQPPPSEVSKEKRQDRAYGLRGDTTHEKKVNPMKEGPKRRFTEKNLKQVQKQTEQQQNGAPAAGTAPSGSNSTQQ